MVQPLDYFGQQLCLGAVVLLEGVLACVECDTQTPILVMVRAQWNHQPVARFLPHARAKPRVVQHGRGTADNAAQIRDPVLVVSELPGGHEFVSPQ